MTRLFSAELLKLRTTNTAWMLLVATLVVTGLAVTGAVIVVADNSSLDLESSRGLQTVLHVSASGAIFVMILGVIVSAGEFRQGTAVDTFLTTPARWRVLAVKLASSAAAGVVFGALAVVVAVAVASHVYTLKGYSFSFESSGVWAILAGSVAYAVLFAVLGAATGSLVRNQVGAMIGWLAWLFVIEQILFGLEPGFGRWLPGAAGRALVRDPNGDLLAQPTAAAALAVYCALFAVVALLIERRRDV